VQDGGNKAMRGRRLFIGVPDKLHSRSWPALRVDGKPTPAESDSPHRELLPAEF
jgi:hypothetical protein